MVEPLQIFISSPGDVQPERVVAQRIVDRLAREFANHFDITAIRWERNPMRATEHFQAQIPRASNAHIVVVIVWTRLGTPLGDDYVGPLSKGTVTGTEFEFEDAYKAAKERGSPDVLVYHKQGIPHFTTEEGILTYQEESKHVKRFVSHWFQAQQASTLTGALRTFSTVDQLEQMLTEHLTELIRKRINVPGLGAPAPQWLVGSPFRGLESFEVIHAPIFFGRTRAQHDLRQLLVQRSANGHPWVTVVGPSGSGKSSLVKAGLLPDLASPGLVEHVGLFRYAIVRPTDVAGDLIAALSSALLRDNALPELADLNYDVTRLANLLTAAPDQAALPVAQGLGSASTASKLLPGVEARLALVIDQIEEVLAARDDPRLLLWLTVLDALAKTGVVWIIATLRADFLQDLERIPALADRFDADGRYALAAPNETELAHIVTRPTLTAGLVFETHPDNGANLGDTLVAAARADRTALPLLEYVLDQLWQGARNRVLTWDAYERLGGIEGAVGQRAEETYNTLGEEAQAALPRVLRSLVGIAPGDGSRPTAQNVPLAEFPIGSAARLLVDAFVNPAARLLVASSDGDAATLRVAHEALFIHWRRAADLIANDRKDLQVRARLAQDAERWLVASDSYRDELLLTPGLRLNEAEDLVDRRKDELSKLVLDYVTSSRAAYEDELALERRRRAEAERQQLEARLLERRATAEEYFARASRTEALAQRVATERRRRDHEEYSKLLLSRASALEDKASRIWREKYELHCALRRRFADPMPPMSIAAPQAVFSLEVLAAINGESLMVHYGEPAAPRLIIVDGGSDANFHKRLRPRLEELHNRWNVDGVLTIELVMVSHYDADRVAGIFKLLEFVAGDGAGRFSIRRLWYNNLTQIMPEASGTGSTFKEELRGIAQTLAIGINEPFEYFVMPSDVGPVEVMLPGGLCVTVIGPRRQRIKNWYRERIKATRERELLPPALVRQLDDAVSEAASNPELVVLRMPPEEARPEFQGGLDQSANNLSSIVVHLAFGDRTMLLTGDARADDILAGLFDAWLLDADGKVCVDVLKLPHSGSEHNISADLLSRVVANHYAISGHPRYRLPRPSALSLLRAARPEGAHTVHFVQHPRKEEADFKAALADSRGTARPRFIDDGKASLIIDTMMPVNY